MADVDLATEIISSLDTFTRGTDVVPTVPVVTMATMPILRKVLHPSMVNRLSLHW